MDSGGLVSLPSPDNSWTGLHAVGPAWLGLVISYTDENLGKMGKGGCSKVEALLDGTPGWRPCWLVLRDKRRAM